MRLHNLLASALGALLLCASTAAAQTSAPLFINVPMGQDSGLVANNGRAPQVVVSFPVQVAGSSWLRLYFEEIDLAGDVLTGNGAILRITSWADGDVQELNARHVNQWQNSSAYMNGDTVQVEVLAYPGTGNSRIKLSSVDAGIHGAEESQCGATDDRVLSMDPRAARLLPIGCTGWLINDCSHCLLTAGHCTGNISVIQFNVPLSNSSGGLNNPPAADQYALDPASLQTNGGQGVGNDWGYFGTFPNPGTGLTAAQAQGAFYTLGTPPPQTTGNSIRITGYGVDNTPSTSNQVQQTHMGPLVDLTGTAIGYVTDTTGGNSGSPVIHEQTGDAVGIHTHGGCSTNGSGNNWGTQSVNPGLQAALANPLGICLGGGLSLVGGAPTIIAPGALTTFQINASGTPVAGTQMLHYRFNPADMFSAISMNSLGSGVYEADLPAPNCGDQPEYYFSSTDNACGLATLPANAPTDTFSSQVGTKVLTFSDDFEADLGWTTAVLGASTGQWERGVPVNDPNWAYDPSGDADGSGQCYLTMNQTGNTDVDGGSVRLFSPALDFSTGGDLLYSYYLNLTIADGVDDLLVEMSSNGLAGPWSTVAIHADSTASLWSAVTISEADIQNAGLTLSADMRVRFTASDIGTASIVEAGVDAVQVGSISCGGGLNTNYCGPAVTNSSGQPGVISATGSAVAADNDVTLLASNLPTNQFGYFLNSQTQGFVVSPPGSQGNLCLSGGIGRYTMSVLNTGLTGTMTLVLDLTNTPTPMGSTSVIAGQAWNFQAWFRDVNPGTTSNFTDALSVTFN